MRGSDRQARRGSCRVAAVLAAGVFAAAGCSDRGSETTPGTWAAVGSRTGADAVELAAELARLDPGGRLGGSTIVDPTPGATLQGTPGIDFIVAVADGQRIIASGGHDQIGTLAAGTTIDGGEGNDLLYGHGADVLLEGGPGSDLLVGLGHGVTVRAGQGDEVHVHDDNPDRILCESGTEDLVVRADPSDDVHSACGDADTPEAPTSAAVPTSTVAGFARPTEAQVTGSGTNDDPFVAPCSSVTSGRPAVCNVEGFPARQTGSFWWSEYVPAYRCPASDPYLYRQGYNPPFTAILIGVEIRESEWPWPVGVNISNPLTAEARGVRGDPIRFTGTATGFGASSATNWSDNPTWYQIVLHCTSDPAFGTNLTM